MTPHPSTGPNVSFGVVMTYDSADGYVLAVSLNATAGPANNNYGPYELTWKFSGGNWSLLTTAGQVPATLSPGLVYDGRDQYVLLYGGRLMDTGASVAPVTNQTWSYRAGSWSNLSANSTAAPYAVVFANLVYDAADEYVLLYDELGLSDTNPNGTVFTTWSYAGGVWTNLTATAGGRPAFYGAMTYDEVDGYVLYFGGFTWWNQLTNATWTFRHGAWTNVTGSVLNAPSPRMYSGIAYDSSQHQVQVFGGLVQLNDFNASAYSGEMWGYAGGVWTLLTTNASYFAPQTMVYDPADNETLLLGSDNSTVAPPDVVTWSYSGGNLTVAAPVFAPTARATDVGHAFTLDVTQSPNGGGLTYLYFGLPAGCPTVNAPTLTCVPSSAGTYAISVKITGSAGFLATARTTVRVGSDPTVVQVALSASPVEVGILLGIHVTATIGSGGLSYSYTGLPSGCHSRNSPYLDCTPTTAGVYDITAQVTDAVGVSAFGVAHLEVTPGLSVQSFGVDHRALDVGQQVTFTVSLGGGVGPYSYVYSGLPAGCLTTDGPSLSCRPAVTGSFSIAFAGGDALGAFVAGGTTLVVHPLPSVTAVVASDRSLLAGGSTQLSTTISGGTAPFQFRYVGLPSGCVGLGGPVVSCSAVPAGTYSVSVTVSDSTGATAVGGTTFWVTPLEVPRVPVSGSAEAGFWWGLAAGAIAIAVAGVAGGNRLRLARQGEEIVRGLRMEQPARRGARLTGPALAPDLKDRGR